MNKTFYFKSSHLSGYLATAMVFLQHLFAEFSSRNKWYFIFSITGAMISQSEFQMLARKKILFLLSIIRDLLLLKRVI